MQTIVVSLAAWHKCQGVLLNVEQDDLHNDQTLKFVFAICCGPLLCMYYVIRPRVLEWFSAVLCYNSALHVQHSF